MTETQPKPICHLCGDPAEREYALLAPGGYTGASQRTCRTCGTYSDSLMFVAAIKSFSTEDRYRLSAITRQASEQGKVLLLTAEKASELLESTPQPSSIEQMDLVLDYLATHTPTGGGPVPLDPRRDYPVAHAHGVEGFTFILDSMAADGLIERIDKSARPHYRITMVGHQRIEEGRKAKRSSPATGWPKVDRGLEEIQHRLEEATTAEQFQAVGLLCRETLVSLAQAAYDPARHGTTDGKQPSPTDAKRMLEAFVGTELRGEPNEEARAHAKATVKLAVALQHDRTADFAAAAVCMEATAFLARVIAIIAGKRGG